MRIVHEVEDAVQVSGGGSRLCNMRGWCGYNGMRIELTIGNDEEVIHIEGIVEHVRKMLTDCLDVVDLIEGCSKEDLGPKRQTDCPNCSDPKQYPNSLHSEDCRLAKEPRP